MPPQVSSAALDAASCKKMQRERAPALSLLLLPSLSVAQAFLPVPTHQSAPIALHGTHATAFLSLAQASAG